MSEIEIYLYRLIGAAGGAIIATAIIPPGTWFPMRRVTVAVFSGLMLTPVAMFYLGWPDEPDKMIAAACVVSACSWWLWHAIIKALAAGWLPFLKAPKETGEP